MTYKRLGDYIREVNVRNKDLKVTNPMGINIEKYFMPSVANVIGTDLSAYKMVGDMQFACNLMHVGRDEKIPMAMHKGEQPLIVSPAYFVFENSKPNELLSDYLMMWFRRPEFDRSAWFYTDADVRGGMTKDALLDMTLLVPSIDRQREIVEEYETLSRRIRLNEQMIEKLEATAQALYRKTFVDNIDKENLPEGWKEMELGGLFDITIGRTPPRAEEKWFCNNKKKNAGVPWVSIADMNKGIYILDTHERLTKEAVERFKIPVIPEMSLLLSFKMTVGRVCITTETSLSNEAIAHFVFKDKPHMCEYLYHFLKNVDYKSVGSTSSITEAINTNLIKQMKITLPNECIIREFHESTHPLFRGIYLRQQENSKLSELQSLLLAKMGNLKR